MFTDHYAQPSSAAGRAWFITGHSPIRSGLTTVGSTRFALQGLNARNTNAGRSTENLWVI